MRFLYPAILCFGFGLGTVAAAQDDATPAPVTDAATATTDRTPAQDPSTGKNNEDELKVQAQLPEAQLKRDARSMQNEVYKSIYNRELKQDQREDVLDE